MNKELLIILSEIRHWATLDNSNQACKRDSLNILERGKCEFFCMYCWLVQTKSKKYYADKIIQTFSQLNK